ncbi:RBR-type E3 ubiquitin transferase [Entamoeba marina]
MSQVISDETKRIIDNLPLSSYRKEMLKKVECVDRKQIISIILKEIAESSQLFDVVEPIVLSLLYDMDFKWFSPKLQCFPDDYITLKYLNIGKYIIDEESVANLMSRDFNRVLCIGALILCDGDVSKALNYITNKLTKLSTQIKNTLKELRGQIEPPRTTLTEAPIFSLSKELYFDLAVRFQSEEEIIKAVSSEETIPKNFKLWYQDLKKRWEIFNQENQQLIEEKGECCDVCYDDVIPNDMITNRCGHSFCRNCMRDHVLTSMRESGKTVGKIKCLSSGCNCCVTIDIVRMLLDDYSFYKYCELLIGSFIEGNKDVICRYCCNEKCNKVLHYKAQYFGGGISAICYCQTNMCLLCGEENHRPATCEMWSKWQEILKKDGLNLKWMRENSRPCPKCGAYIEKNGGCQWMACYKCHAYFCWVCMQVTNNHQHKPGQVCKPYQGKKDDADYVEEELVHYLTHYDLQDVGVKQSKERYNLIVQIINERKTIASTLAPLYEASLVEIDAHTVLRNLCVYVSNKKDKKDLIEYQQKQFQFQAEMLTKRIQEILKKDVINLEMMADLTSFVKPIKDSFEKITKSIEDELEGDID